jgi:nucleoside-diphosphate-sugar epimerase
MKSNDLAGRRVLVTGGVGFIGSNLAIALVDLGAQVTLLDSMLPAYGANLFNIDSIRDRVTLNFADVRDKSSLDYVVRDQDVIFSLAGQVSHLRSMVDPETDLEINCRSQLSLLEACRHNNPGVRVVFASTRQVYGRPQALPVSEAHPCRPVDVNGINNLAAEMYYGLYHQVYGIDTVSLRLTNTYGPRMDLRTGDKGFVGVFLHRALRDAEIQVFGTGTQRRDFNYIDDVVEALLRAAVIPGLSGQVFNLGFPLSHSLLDVVAILQSLTGCRYRVIPFPDDLEAIDIGDYCGDFARFRDATGWIPRVGLEDGLARTIGFFRNHQQQYL